jgi:hypothetical protein
MFDAEPLQIGLVLLQSAYGFVACHNFTISKSGICFHFFHFHSNHLRRMGYFLLAASFILPLARAGELYGFPR